VLYKQVKYLNVYRAVELFVRCGLLRSDLVCVSTVFRLDYMRGQGCSHYVGTGATDEETWSG